MPKYVLIRVFLIALLTAAGFGCTRTRVPLTELEVPMPDLARAQLLIPGWGEGNYRYMTWTEAFDALHEKLAREYPYTEQKGVDWEALHARFAPLVAAAEEAGDEAAYYRALRQYAFSVPDGLLGISPREEVREEDIGAAYGFTIAELPGEHFLVSSVIEGSPADEAGMQVMAEVLAWDGGPVANVLERAPLEWVDLPPATTEGRRIAQRQLATRAPAGSQARITFQNPQDEPQEVMLTAAPDDFATLKAGSASLQKVDAFDPPLYAEMLEGGVGYIRIRFIAPSFLTPFPERAFQQALEDLLAQGLNGLIIDLRGNTGGSEDLVPAFAGHFLDSPQLYQAPAYYKRRSQSFEAAESDRIMVQPRDPYLNKPTLVLVDERTMGAAEGLVMLLKPLEHVQIMGFTGTHGSFGMPGGEISMPADITITYPIGRAQDEQEIVPIVSDAQGIGGIQPDIRITLEREALARQALNKEDILLLEALDRLRERRS